MDATEELTVFAVLQLACLAYAQTSFRRARSMAPSATDKSVSKRSRSPIHGTAASPRAHPALAPDLVVHVDVTARQCADRTRLRRVMTSSATGKRTRC